MWNTRTDSAPVGAPGNRTNNGVMAHRRGLGSRKVLISALLVLVFAVLLGGSVYVSNRVTEFRSEIARLESRREFLESGSARLLTVWNKATSPQVITTRARRELGLVVPTDPGLVLVQVPDGGPRTSRWQRLLDSMGGGDPAQASELNPAWVMGSMVSLTPLSSPAAGVN